MSTGEMFSPPLMIMSTTRPVTNRSPSSSRVAGVAGEVPAVAQGLGVGVLAFPVAFKGFVVSAQGRQQIRPSTPGATRSSTPDASRRTTRSRVLMPARPALPGLSSACWSIEKVYTSEEP